MPAASTFNGAALRRRQCSQFPTVEAGMKSRSHSRKSGHAWRQRFCWTSSALLSPQSLAGADLMYLAHELYILSLRQRFWQKSQVWLLLYFTSFVLVLNIDDCCIEAVRT
jgi:hypothetical protein